MGKNNSYKISISTEIESFLKDLPEWKYEDNSLKSSFILPDFETSIEVINEVAKVATKMDHHPRLTNTYNQLEFSLCTHSVGDKVTSYDLALAKAVSDIVAGHK